MKCPVCHGAYVLRIEGDTRSLTCPHCCPEKVHPTLLHVMGLPTRDQLTVTALIEASKRKPEAA